MEYNNIYRRTIMVKTWHADGTFSSASYGRWRPQNDDDGNVWLERVGGRHAGKIMYVYGPVIDEEYGEILGYDCWNYRSKRF